MQSCIWACGPHLLVELLLPVAVLLLPLTLQLDVILPLSLLLLLSSFQGVPQDSDLAILKQNFLFHLFQLDTQTLYMNLKSPGKKKRVWTTSGRRRSELCILGARGIL